MLPNQVDTLVLGTSLVNSIVAAALSRIGQSVLHVDTQGYYGDNWASFSIQQLEERLKSDGIQVEQVPQELLDKSKMFCIDLTPRLLFSTGAMVDLLVKSNVSRYHDFKNNIRILSKYNGQLHLIPCRRSDVFNSNLLQDLVDKRRLMKFMESCVKFGNQEESCPITQNAHKTIKSYLNELKLSDMLQHFVINSIAMVDPDVKLDIAAEKVKNFMFATERYGNSPFLFPLYGCGEYPQSFCRLSAVFGGIYCLNTDISNVQIDETSLLSTNIADTLIKTQSLVIDHKYKDKISNLEDNRANVIVTGEYQKQSAHAIFITRNSIHPNEENMLSLIKLDNIYCLELTSSVMVCPPEYKIVYLWSTEAHHKPEDVLLPAVELIEQSNVVWKTYYSQPFSGDSIDYSQSIEEAREIFHKICPDQEFLPRAPDPAEIIHC